MKIVLITNDSIKGKYLEKLIVENDINLVKVIKFVRKYNSDESKIARNISKLRLYLGKFKRRILQTSITNKALDYEAECKDFYEQKLLSYINKKSKGNLETGIETMFVENVNSDKVVSELRRISADICVVWGTPIIKENVLQTCKIFMNAHTSILPYFKGTRSEFWQCIEKKPNAVGVTFHKIDAGVDTGPIIEQIQQKNIIPFESYHLRYQNTITILENYPRIILSVINGTANYSIQKENKNCKTYRSADITIPLRAECYSKLLQTKSKFF
jgi:folate-dependent phosphoribosylglycinamide formyltransferase PurN